MSEPTAKTSDEAKFLAQQADDARLAMAEIARDLKANVAETLDPHKLTRSHPWLAVGAAAVAGFAASWIATPSPEQKIARELRRLRREAEKPAVENPSAGNGQAAARGSGIPWMTLLRPAALAAVRGLASALAAAQAASHNRPTSQTAGAPLDDDAEPDAVDESTEPGSVRNI